MIKKILIITMALLINSAANAISLTCTQKTVSVKPGVDYKVKSNYLDPEVLIVVNSDTITTKTTSTFAGKLINSKRSYKIIKRHNGILTAISESTGGTVATLQLNLRTNYFAKSFLLVTSAEATSGKCVERIRNRHSLKINNTEYEKKRTIAKLEANLKLQKVKLEYAAKNLKLHKKKLEQVTKNLGIHKKKLSRYQEISKLKSKIHLEQDKERELEMEDLLNIVKAHYVEQIAEKVKDQWRYLGAENNWGCDVHILQDISGNVESVSTQSCNVTYLAKKKSFEKAIERAVYKASPLPRAPISSVFDKEILFHFKVN